MKRLAMKVEMIAQVVEASLLVEELCAQEPRIPLAELAMSNEVNGSFVQSMVNGINGVSVGINGVHEEPEGHSVKEYINLLASVSMNYLVLFVVYIVLMFNQMDIDFIHEILVGCP